jgi:hypothetical protein
MARYDIGDTVRVTGTFTDATDSLRDPTAINLTIRSPNGRVTNITYAAGQIIKSGTGVYYYDVDANEPGRWFYRFWSTGSYKAAGEESFLIRDANAR